MNLTQTSNVNRKTYTRRRSPVIHSLIITQGVRKWLKARSVWRLPKPIFAKPRKFRWPIFYFFSFKNWFWGQMLSVCQQVRRGESCKQSTGKITALFVQVILFLLNSNQKYFLHYLLAVVVELTALTQNNSPSPPSHTQTNTHMHTLMQWFMI